MSRLPVLLAGALISASVAAAPAQAADPLSLDEAVTIAIESGDPTVTRFEEKAAALKERAVAESQLPDPRLKLDMMNVPTDRFSFTQEPMTQARVGLQQAFPAGDTLSLKREKRDAQAGGAVANRDLELRNLILQTRLAWLELYYQLASQDKINESRAAVEELTGVITASFASGRKTSQDVLRLELELDLLRDRLVEAERQARLAQATLARYVGPEAAQRPLPENMPALRVPSGQEVLLSMLPDHPMVAVADAAVAANTVEIEIAEEQYKPEWMLDVGYGVRGDGRPDFASVGVSLNLPFFTGKRQDRNVSAARHERSAARMERQTRLLELNQVLGRTYADWEKLTERITLYERAVLERAAAAREASLIAYQSGVSDFDDMVQARLAELNAQLALLRLRVDRAEAQARLLYLEGDYNE